MTVTYHHLTRRITLSSTLSRRIRRIGILPTTYKESSEQRLVTNIQNGKKTQVEKTFTIRRPIRNRENLTAQETEARRTRLIAEARRTRLDRKAGIKTSKKAA